MAGNIVRLWSGSEVFWMRGVGDVDEKVKRKFDESFFFDALLSFFVWPLVIFSFLFSAQVNQPVSFKLVQKNGFCQTNSNIAQTRFTTFKRDPMMSSSARIHDRARHGHRRWCG